MKYYVAHAFTDKVFGGNPAAVVLLPSDDEMSTPDSIESNSFINGFPPDEIMVKIAEEFRYSETAFVKQLGENEFNIRYFTPTAEVELCGHATIAAFHVLLHAGIIKDNCTYTNHTLAETITVHVDNGNILMGMASPRLIKVIDNPSEIKKLYEIMGINYQPTLYTYSDDKTTELLPKIITTGLPDIILPVANKEQLNALAPDMKKLSDLSEEYAVTGVHAFALNNEYSDNYSIPSENYNNTKESDSNITENNKRTNKFNAKSVVDNINDTNNLNSSAGVNAEKVYCDARNFAPLFGIDEEAATGTANGALTYYLYLDSIISGNAECMVLQGEAMNRPSAIMTKINNDKNSSSNKEHNINNENAQNVNIQVGGTAVVFAKGELVINEPA